MLLSVAGRANSIPRALGCEAERIYVLGSLSCLARALLSENPMMSELPEASTELSSLLNALDSSEDVILDIRSRRWCWCFRCRLKEPNRSDRPRGMHLLRNVHRFACGSLDSVIIQGPDRVDATKNRVVLRMRERT